MRAFVLSLAVGFLIAGAAVAAAQYTTPAACSSVETCGSPDCCGRCGNCCPCEKYCRVVCEMKKVKKHVWVVKCSDFCASLPNCGLKCREGCGSCEAEQACCDGCATTCDPCAAEKNKCVVPPKCGKVRTKKTLEKKEVVCQVPTYKCIVVYACLGCGPAECGQPEAMPPAAAPTPGKSTRSAPLPPVVGASYVK